MSDDTPTSLRDAITKVLTEGPASAPEIMNSIEERWPGLFPYADWLNVHDECKVMFGDPNG